MTHEVEKRENILVETSGICTYFSPLGKTASREHFFVCFLCVLMLDIMLLLLIFVIFDYPLLTM